MTKNKPSKKHSKNEQLTSFFSLFRFATRRDKFYMIVGSIAAAVNGAAMPIFTLFLGQVANDFGPTKSSDQILDAAGSLCLDFLILGVVVFVCGYFAYSTWLITCEVQTTELRRRYFKSLLSQEIAYYDSINPNEVSTKVAEECFNIQQGIGEKVPNIIYNICLLISGFIVGIVKGWQLALVFVAFFPVMAITGAVFVVAMQKMTKVNNDAYAEAGAISEEVLNAIRTIVSLGGQDKETKRYKTVMEANSEKITKYSIISALSMGVVFFSLFFRDAVGFTVGSIFVENGLTNPVTGDPYSAGDVLTIFFAIIMASVTPIRMTPCLKAFAVARESATRAYKIIDKKSLISIDDPRGLKPTSVEGNIRFKDLSFAYPLKPDRTILNKVNFEIRRNEKTALVGESGCGKTTCIQLIERFYDIVDGNGSVSLDGNELKSLNLKWLRENIGYVGQEPVLFATTIKENILMAKEDATDEEIWQALGRANAEDFVRGLPQQLNTFVGNNGTQLSGGQKQRLAIARAILKNPPILLLDEATSALDRKNEMEIQKTLDDISQGRTTIVIAHRLTTIQNADHIIVFDKGVIVEEGKHDELVEKKGRYYALQHLQLMSDDSHKEYKPEVIKDKVPEQVTRKISELTIRQNASNSIQTVVPLQTGVQPNKDQNYVIQIEEDAKPSKNSVQVTLKKQQYSSYYIIKRLLSYNRSDTHYIILGSIAAVVHGMVLPFYAVLISNMLKIFSFPDASDFRSRSNFISGMFIVAAGTAAISIFVQMSCFTIIAERLSRRIRAQVFQKYIKMPIGWFDEPQNAPGALGSKLSTDATLINNLISQVFGMYIQASSGFITGVIIAFVADWKLALIGLGCSPFLIAAGRARAKFQAVVSSESGKVYEESINFVSEAVNNMRTVASFGREEKLLKNYMDKLDEPLKKATRKGIFTGLTFGFSECVNFILYAITFYCGAVFITHGTLDFKNMFQAVLAIIMACITVGNALQSSSDLGEAMGSATKIFNIVDEQPAIDMDDPNQNVVTPIKGDIEFKNVWFKYPSREKQIFKNFSLKINPSTKVAMVGPSGCGKSTILALLQRFYDPDQGEILLDGINLKKYDLKRLRDHFGVVSQEPVLFNGTIEYNIKYSKEDATEAEMKEAARKANAIQFIENNEFDIIGDDAQATSKYGTGFQRKVGPKGSQLSGGQKQRIAIARAIMKNPTVLILDEATSALDTQNEQEVQKSLDGIMKGKTSVIVAHRISTIRDADEILVFSDGMIVERGNYERLNEMQGVFYKLERGLNTTAPVVAAK